MVLAEETWARLIFIIIKKKWTITKEKQADRNLRWAKLKAHYDFSFFEGPLWLFCSFLVISVNAFSQHFPLRLLFTEYLFHNPIRSLSRFRTPIFSITLVLSVSFQKELRWRLNSKQCSTISMFSRNLSPIRLRSTRCLSFCFGSRFIKLWNCGL